MTALSWQTLLFAKDLLSSWILLMQHFQNNFCRGLIVMQFYAWNTLFNYFGSHFRTVYLFRLFCLSDAVALLAIFNNLLAIIAALSQPATGPSIACQGSDVTLQCVIVRNGVAVDLFWRRNGTLVDTSVLNNHRFVFNSTYNAITDLVITNVTLEDNNTEYECIVLNSDITSSLVLNVTGT